MQYRNNSSYEIAGTVPVPSLPRHEGSYLLTHFWVGNFDMKVDKVTEVG